MSPLARSNSKTFTTPLLCRDSVVRMKSSYFAWKVGPSSFHFGANASVNACGDIPALAAESAAFCPRDARQYVGCDRRVCVADMGIAADVIDGRRNVVGAIHGKRSVQDGGPPLPLAFFRALTSA